MVLTSFHPTKAHRHKRSGGRLRRCLGPLFLLKGSQRLLCSDLKHMKSLSHGCLTFRVSDVCWQLSSERNALKCARRVQIGNSWLFHRRTCFSVYAWTWPTDIILVSLFFFFGALFSEHCVNNTSKHSREHFQQAESHTFAGVKWWIMDFLLKQECKQCSRGREQRAAILVYCVVS